LQHGDLISISMGMMHVATSLYVPIWLTFCILAWLRVTQDKCEFDKNGTSNHGVVGAGGCDSDVVVSVVLMLSTIFWAGMLSIILLPLQMLISVAAETFGYWQSKIMCALDLWTQSI